MAARRSFAVAAGSRGSTGTPDPYSLYTLLIHDRALDPVGGVGTGEALGAAIPFALALARILAGADAANRVKSAIVYQ